MEINRKPYQGVWNIIRFNPQFYIAAVVAVTIMFVVAQFLPSLPQQFVYLFITILLTIVTVSLAASYYVYDASGLYKLDWVNDFNIKAHETVININAGFDEITPVLKYRFIQCNILTFDFYDPEKHTEPSIERARTAYPPDPATIKTNTTVIPLKDNSAEYIFVFLAAHEIRDAGERALFFKELKRIVKPSGRIFVTEHLRNLPNFIAYTVGYLHFYSKTSWLNIFEKVGLHLEKEKKNNILLSTFILRKDGDTL